MESQYQSHQDLVDDKFEFIQRRAKRKLKKYFHTTDFLRLPVCDVNIAGDVLDDAQRNILYLRAPHMNLDAYLNKMVENRVCDAYRRSKRFPAIKVTAPHAPSTKTGREEYTDFMPGEFKRAYGNFLSEERHREDQERVAKFLPTVSPDEHVILERFTYPIEQLMLNSGFTRKKVAHLKATMLQRWQSL